MKEGYRPYLESVDSVLAEAGSEAHGLTSAEAAARLGLRLFSIPLCMLPLTVAAKH